MSGQKKILILGSDAGTVNIVDYAKCNNIYTIVVDNKNVEKSYTKQIADEYGFISTASVDDISNRYMNKHIDGLICGASDFNTDRLIELSELLKIPCYTTKKTWLYSRDKYKFKQICIKEGAPVAKDYHCNNFEDSDELDSLNIEYPVVVKPVDLCASRGVSYCYNRTDLVEAIRKVRKLSKNTNVIIEQKLNGKEFVAYYAFTENASSMFLFHTVNNHYDVDVPCDVIESTATDYLDLFVRDCNDEVKRVLKECGCKSGLAWVQLIFHEDGHFYIIEMGYRFGGDMVLAPYKAVSGFDAVKWNVETALGKEHSDDELPPEITGYNGKCACAYRLRVKEEGKIDHFVEGKELKQNGINVMYFRYPGDVVEKHCVIATAHISAKNFNELCRKIDIVNKNFVIESKGNNILLEYKDFQQLKNESFL